MPVSKYVMVERTLWIAKCPKCGNSSESESSKKEIRCKECGIWVPYEKVTFESKEYNGVPGPAARAARGYQ